jgi:hypothetical protein
VPQNISGTFESHKPCGANCMIGCRGHDRVDADAGKMSGCRAFLGPLYGQAEVVVKGLDGFEVERVIIDKNTNRVEGAWGWVNSKSESGGGSDPTTRQECSSRLRWSLPLPDRSIRQLSFFGAVSR